MKDTQNKKIGLLGGSFDPIHTVHLNLAKQALIHLDLDEIQLIPAKQPWQKEQLKATTEQRLEMLNLALQDHPKIKVNPIELDRLGKTYTYDTVKDLDPKTKYYWLMGSDQLQNFTTWYKWQEVLDYVQLVVAKRPGYSLSIPTELKHYLEQKKYQIVELPFDEQGVSSTDIRNALMNGDKPVGIPNPVFTYIKNYKLYIQS